MPVGLKAVLSRTIMSHNFSVAIAFSPIKFGPRCSFMMRVTGGA